jgi:GTP-binding protein
VAIVGRANVGKSTLFNRLVGRRQAIVHDRPGVTRDRLAAAVEIGPERWIELFDTGGLMSWEDSPGLAEQVLTAARESEVVLFIVDGKVGLTTADEAIWERIRPLGKQTILVVTKSDVKGVAERSVEFHGLGIHPLTLVSAEHGHGIEELRDLVAERLPEEVPRREEDAIPSVAIVGRPNVGKSSLLNCILGERRAVVAPEPGTTRDPVDSVVERDGTTYRLIDTAGIRRRSKTSETAEEIAVMMAARQIDRADLAILVLDASTGVTTGDLSIAGAIWDKGRAAVVAANKWDLVGEEERARLERDWPRMAELLAGPPRVQVSALTGRGIDGLFQAIDLSLDQYLMEIGTGELNRLLEKALRGHNPPHIHGRPWKALYGTQVSSRPPTFLIFANRTLPRKHAYRRYLENRLRADLGITGMPVRIVIKRR